VGYGRWRQALVALLTLVTKLLLLVGHCLLPVALVAQVLRQVLVTLVLVARYLPLVVMLEL